MKSYWLFAGTIYYPLGGWDDFKGSYTALEDAMEVANKQHSDAYSWWHVVESATLTIVARNT